MSFPDFSIYCRDNLISQYETQNNTSCLDYILQLKRLLNVIEDVAKSIEYGVKIKTPRLSINDKLIIYRNVKPYFQTCDIKGTPQRIRYSDIIVLNGRYEKNSILNLFPDDVIFKILKLKNEAPFMSYHDFIKFIPKG